MKLPKSRLPKSRNHIIYSTCELWQFKSMLLLPTQESMLTLFLSISGGMSWEDALLPLRSASELACAFMILYIVIAVFAVLNAVAPVEHF